MRYSFDEGLIDFGKSEVVPAAVLVDELIELVAEDAEFLGCMDELIGIRKILERGTSAHQQVAEYDRQRSSGVGHEEAVHAVVDILVENTADV